MVAVRKGHSVKFFVKKAERISAAIHLVTAHIAKEPVPDALRKASVTMLDMLADRGIDSDTIGTIFLRQESLLSVLFNAGQVSLMNYQILAEEYRNLRSLTEEYASEDGTLAAPLLTREYFKVPSREAPEPPLKIDRYVDDEIDQRQSLRSKGRTKGQFSAEKGHLATGDDIKDIRSSELTPQVERGKRILSIVEMLGVVTIKDISRHVKDCSEKTIQRELLSFVEKGTLRKEGERRWSTYSLVHKEPTS